MKMSLVMAMRIEKEEAFSTNDMAEPHDMQILVSLAHDMETLAIVSALVTI